MFQIVYASTATAPFSDAELRELLVKSRSNNQRGGLGGMLLYRAGSFLQVLEGEEDLVRALVARIGADPRHSALVVLHAEHIDKREFPDWSMGFRNLDDENTPVGFSSLLDSSLSLANLGHNASLAKRLLLAFKITKDADPVQHA